ncbi:MAG TPA: hypothetical protein VFN35_04050 [Ktedonobacteraceae bacterium]|nr:hypothetical protein [Ktedonobacteraceae bacterium]
MAEGVLFRFANEEMVYLLRALHIVDFPGLAPDPLKELEDSQKSSLMQIADHTLRARGLVHWRGETEREIDPLITKLLLQCARPEHTLFVDMMDTSSAAKKLLYIFSEQVIVEQQECEPQVQQYLVVPARDAFIKRLHTLVIQEQNSLSSSLPGGHINQYFWLEALNIARSDEDRASALLAKSLPRQTASALAAAVHNLQRIEYLALWKQTPSLGKRYPARTLTVVTGNGQLILLWWEEPGKSLLQVIPASVEQAKEYISLLLPPE